MKIPLHKAKEMDEEYGEEACLYREDEDTVIPKGCSYSGSDIMSHPKGECFHCDYERVQKEEDERGLDWLDRTEAWDYYDYWHNKYRKEA